MVKVYFEIFGTRLVKEFTEKEYQAMNKDQLEYQVRCKLKVNKVVKIEDKPSMDIPDSFKEIFGIFNNKG